MSHQVAFFSDPRGCLPALQEAFQYLKRKGISEAYCLGNVVGDGAEPNETVAFLRKRRIPCVMGSVEAALAGRSPPPRLFATEAEREAFEGLVARNADALESSNLRFLQGLSTEYRFGAGGRRVLAAHGRVGTPWKQLAPDAPQGAVLQELEASRADLVVLGSERGPFVREVPGGRVVGTGTLHDPRHHEGRLVVLDVATSTVTHVSIPYVLA